MATQRGRIGTSWKVGLAPFLLLGGSALGLAQAAPLLADPPVSADPEQRAVVKAVVARSDSKAWLIAARGVLEKGDLDGAEALVAEAEKAQSRFSVWYLVPWADSPAKVRRDIQSARSNKEFPVFRPANSKQAQAAKPPLKRPLPSGVSDQNPVAKQIEKEARNSQPLAKAVPLLATGSAVKRQEKPPAATKAAGPPSSDKSGGAPQTIPTLSEGRAFLQRGRQLLRKNELEGAEFFCQKAALAQGWTWFEDTPAKLRGDVEKAHAERNRKKADALLAEAHDRLAKGAFQEARNLALLANRMHGPYSFWDKSERPQDVLNEINRVEARRVATRVLAGTVPRSEPVAQAARQVVHTAKSEPPPPKPRSSELKKQAEEPKDPPLPVLPEPPKTALVEDPPLPQQPSQPPVLPPPIVAAPAKSERTVPPPVLPEPPKTSVVERPPLLQQPGPPPVLPPPAVVAAPAKSELTFPPPEIATAAPPSHPPSEENSAMPGSDSIGEKKVAEANPIPSPAVSGDSLARAPDQGQPPNDNRPFPTKDQPAKEPNEPNAHGTQGTVVEESDSSPAPENNSTRDWPLQALLLMALGTTILFGSRFWPRAAKFLNALLRLIIVRKEAAVPSRDLPETETAAQNPKLRIGVIVDGTEALRQESPSLLPTYEDVVTPSPCLMNCANSWEVDSSHPDGIKPIDAGGRSFVVQVSAASGRDG
jgi:hypothetical protein